MERASPRDAIPEIEKVETKVFTAVPLQPWQTVPARLGVDSGIATLAVMGICADLLTTHKNALPIGRGGIPRSVIHLRSCLSLRLRV